MVCPFCKEDIQEGAIKCRHCGSTLTTNTPNINQQNPQKLESYKGTIILENPLTREQKKLTAHTGGTWAFLFGPFHALYHQLWILGLSWFIIGIIILVSTGLPVAYLFNIIYIVFAKKIIAKKYLKRGYSIVAHYPNGKVPK